MSLFLHANMKLNETWLKKFAKYEFISDIWQLDLFHLIGVKNEIVHNNHYCGIVIQLKFHRYDSSMCRNFASSFLVLSPCMIWY